MFSIGQFSRMTRLSVKMLRHYHEIGLLEPERVDAETGYRYYGPRAVERARIIRALKEMELPLKAIAEILGDSTDDSDLVGFLELHRSEIGKRIAHYESVANSLDSVIAQAKATTETSARHDYDVEERTLEPVLFAGVRMRGQYSQIGNAFSTVGRRAGFKIAGPAKGLYYDDEYKEEDADFEGGFPVRRPVSHPDVSCRELPGGTAITLVHIGPYDTIHDSYARLFEVLERRDLQPALPSREVYLKGPGMIFKGNPVRYKTEIQFLVD